MRRFLLILVCVSIGFPSFSSSDFTPYPWESSANMFMVDVMFWRCIAIRYPRFLPLLHLPALNSYPLIQLLHHANERRIFVPEWRIIPLLLNQQCRDTCLRCGG